MKTLLENITFVKGVEYLIVVAFCLGFIAFWILVHNREIEAKKIVSVVIPLSLVFSGAAVVLAMTGSHEPAVNTTIPESAIPEYYSNGSPATIAAHSSAEWLNVSNPEYLAITSGPAVKFHQIMSDKVSCKTCHHNSGNEIRACKDCHSTPFNPQNSSMPGLKAAYHQKCMDCHKEVFNGPQSCTKCHNGEASGSLTVSAPDHPHGLTWENCSRCHTNRIPGGGQEAKIVYHDNASSAIQKASRALLGCLPTMQDAQAVRARAAISRREEDKIW